MISFDSTVSTILSTSDRFKEKEAVKLSNEFSAESTSKNLKFKSYQKSFITFLRNV